MPAKIAEQIRGSLTASRIEADRIIAEAEERARALSARAEGVQETLAETQLERIGEIRAQINQNQVRIDAAYVQLVETMAAASLRLVEAARDADFTLPPWPGGISRAVEIKLSETREVTLRFAAGGAAGEPRDERL